MSEREIGDLFSVKLRVGVGFLIGGIAFGLIGLYALLPQYRAELTYAAPVLGGAGTLYAAFYAAASFHANAKRTRQGLAFNMLSALNQPEATKVQALCDKFVGTDSISPKEIISEISANSDLRHAVVYVLSHFEDISIAIQEDHADERVLYRSLQRLVPLYWAKFAPYIKQQRQSGAGAVLYSEFERLAKAWEANRSVRSNELFEQA